MPILVDGKTAAGSTDDRPSVVAAPRGPNGLYVTYFTEDSGDNILYKFSRLATSPLSVAATYVGLGPAVVATGNYQRLYEAFNDVGFLSDGTVVLFAPENVEAVSPLGFFEGILPAPWYDHTHVYLFTDAENLTSPTQVTLADYGALDNSSNTGQFGFLSDGTNIIVSVSGELAINDTPPDSTFRDKWYGFFNPQTGAHVGNLVAPPGPMSAVGAQPGYIDNNKLAFTSDNTHWWIAWQGTAYYGDFTNGIAGHNFVMPDSSGIHSLCVDLDTDELFCAGYDAGGSPIIHRVDPDSLSVLQSYSPTTTEFVPDSNSFSGPVAAAGGTLYTGTFLTTNDYPPTGEIADGVWAIDIATGSGVADPALRLGVPTPSLGFYGFGAITAIQGRGTGHGTATATTRSIILANKSKSTLIEIPIKAGTVSS